MKKFVQKLAFVTTTAFASMSALAAMPTVSSTAYAADEQSNVYAQVKQALQTDYPVTLPKSVAVQSGKHLTAKTSVSQRANFRMASFASSGMRVSVASCTSWL